MGLVSGLGLTEQEFWKHISESKTAVKEVDEPNLKELNLAGWAPASQFKPDKNVAHKDRQIQFALHAAEEALAGAKLSPKKEPERFGVYLSSSKGGVHSFEQTKNSAGFLPNFLSSSASHEVAVRFGMAGPVLNFVSACASGAHSIMMAARLIEENPNRIILAGSTEASLTPLILAGFTNMGVLARKNSLPAEQVFSPFDKNRCGFIAGEGAALLVLESAQSAKKRGVTPYCQLIGSAAVSDATHFTRFEPNGDSIYRAILRVSEVAETPIEKIDMVNLHGTATIENDMIESQAIKKCWAQNALPRLNATKPLTGHLLGASGAIEALISVLSLKHQTILPTQNLKNPDFGLDLELFMGETKPFETAASLSYGFGGHIGALLFKRWDN